MPLSLVWFADHIRTALEGIGIALIGIGGVATVVMLLASVYRRRFSVTPIRLNLARYLSLALEFQLAADIVETAVTPDWPQIERLAAIAVLRTALNWSLSREMREERGQLGVPAP